MQRLEPRVRRVESAPGQGGILEGGTSSERAGLSSRAFVIGLVLCVFLGLVLGEMTCAGIWAIIGMLTGASTGYRILLD